jgi:hypothetical protein
MTEVFETPGSVTVEVRIPTGRVLVETTDEPRTVVELNARGRDDDTLRQIEVTHDERAGRHVVSIEHRKEFRLGPIRISLGGDVEVRVKCPVGTELDFSGASTELRADGQYSKVSARTSSGDMRIGDVSGKLELKTASGDVTLESLVSEKAALVTVSGDVEIGRVDASLSLRTVSGDVELGGSRGALTVATTSGDVDVRGLEAGELRIQSVSGDVRIAVARGTQVFVDAASVSGDLRSELSMSPEGPPADAPAGEVVPLYVKTVSGDVALVRAPAPVG